MIDRSFYEAILRFEESEEAQNLYYSTMDSLVERNGKTDTVRNQILRAYAMLFCDDLGATAGHAATMEEVEDTADRLYLGEPGFDPKHWYRMQHHFPIIDEDNYDRFAALVIADLRAGPLHDAAVKGDDILLLGERNPLLMNREERQHQKIRRVHIGDFSPGGNKA